MVSWIVIIKAKSNLENDYYKYYVTNYNNYYKYYVTNYNSDSKLIDGLTNKEMGNSCVYMNI